VVDGDPGEGMVRDAQLPWSVVGLSWRRVCRHLRILCCANLARV